LTLLTLPTLSLPALVVEKPAMLQLSPLSVHASLFSDALVVGAPLLGVHAYLFSDARISDDDDCLAAFANPAVILSNLSRFEEEWEVAASSWPRWACPPAAPPLSL